METQIEINEVTGQWEGEIPIKMHHEDIILPIGDNKLKELQKNDKFCKNILNLLKAEKLHDKNPYFIEEDILKRYVEDNKQRFEVIVLPQTLIGPALQLAHEGTGSQWHP